MASELTPEAIAELRKMHGEAVLCRAQFEGKITARMAGVFVDRLPALLDAALWAVNLQADMKAGIDAIDRGEFTTVDKMRDELNAEVLDAAERCAAAEAERDCLSSQCDIYKADIDAIRAMLPNVEGDCTRDLVRSVLAAAEAQAKAAGELLRALNEAMDLIHELRSYCRDAWDWKYGKEWDDQTKAVAERIEAAERAGVKP